MNVSIFALGYVGPVSAACFAERGHNAVGVDPNGAKAGLLSRGFAPIVEPSFDNIVRRPLRVIVYTPPESLRWRSARPAYHSFAPARLAKEMMVLTSTIPSMCEWKSDRDCGAKMESISSAFARRSCRGPCDRRLSRSLRRRAARRPGRTSASATTPNS